MGGNRVRKQNTEVELDRYHPKDAQRLLAFNMTKKRVVGFCNQDFEDDPFDKAKNYSTWHRAMDGHEVWIGIVQALEGLYTLQERYPWRYLPDVPPEENLHTWMKQLGSADWWMKVLQPEASPSAFRAWFSNRPMRKKKIEDVHARVGEWWARLQEQVALARRYTFAEQRRDHMWHGGRISIESWDTWCKDRIDDGIDDVRAAMIEEALLLSQYHLSLIDLANPKALRESSHDQDYLDRDRRNWGSYFDERQELGFPFALSRTPPDFDPGPTISDHQWGDRRDERCFKDMNVELYNLHYRASTMQWWDENTREVMSASEIVQVSRDGETWRDANEREREGWDPGNYWFAYAFEHDGGDMRNSYQRERDELLEKRSKARKDYEYSADGSEFEARAKATLDRLEHELVTLHLSE